MSDRNLHPVMQAALEPFMPTVALASIAADQLASNACREAPEDLRGLSSSALRWLGEQAAIVGDGELCERVAAEQDRRPPLDRPVIVRFHNYGQDDQPVVEAEAKWDGYYGLFLPHPLPMCAGLALEPGKVLGWREVGAV